jgi:hypothetical protein
MAGRWTRQQDATLRRRTAPASHASGSPWRWAARPTPSMQAGGRLASPPTHAAVPGRALPTTCSAPPTRWDCRWPRWRGGSAGHSGPLATTPARAATTSARAWTPAEDQELGRVWRRGGELARLGRRLGRSWRPCACGPSGSAWSNRRGGAAGSPTRTAGCAPATRRGGPAPRSPPAWPAAPPGRSPLAPAGSGWPATRRWTRQEDAQLRRLAEHGTCLKRAAGILARTPQALRVRACRLGIRPPPTGPRGGGAGPRPTTSCSPVGPTSTRRGLRSCWVARRGRAPQAGGPWPAPGMRTLAPPRHRSAAAAEPSPAAAAGTEFRPGNGPVLGVAANRLGLPPGAVKQLAAALLTRP